MIFEDLRGRTAVITGGARGIGLSIATALAEYGVHVALLDQLPSVEDAAVQLAKRHAVPTYAVTVDVTSADAVLAGFAEVESHLGTPTILVTSAGISRWSDAEATPAAEWRQLMDINLNGTFFAAQAFARHLITKGVTGNAVFIGSMSASVVNVPQHQAGYNTSKAGVIQLSRSLAVEWAPHGIRVNTISPGYILSEMTKQFLATNRQLVDEWAGRTPLGRLGTPEDLHGLALLLASEASSYITGQDFIADGGYTAI